MTERTDALLRRRPRHRARAWRRFACKASSRAHEAPREQALARAFACVGIHARAHGRASGAMRVQRAGPRRSSSAKRRRAQAPRRQPRPCGAVTSRARRTRQARRAVRAVRCQTQCATRAGRVASSARGLVGASGSSRVTSRRRCCSDGRKTRQLRLRARRVWRPARRRNVRPPRRNAQPGGLAPPRRRT